MSQAPRPDWNEVLHKIKAYFAPVAIVSAMKLDVFTPLAAAPKTAQELAADLGVPVRRLRMLLYSLATTGLITRQADQFANSAVADEFLVRGRPRYMGGGHELYSDIFATMLSTAESVRTGRPVALHDWEHMPDEQVRGLLRGLNSGAAASGRTLAARHDFARFKRVLDVGGGGGGLAIGLCESCPGLDAKIVELPRIARIAEDLVASTGLTGRIRAVGHDISDAPLADLHDAAVLRNFFQVLPTDVARRAVKNVAQSLRPDGEVFIIGLVLDDDCRGPEGALGMNLFFLNAFEHGEAYTESEYREWLDAAGFIDISRVPFAGFDHSLITARKRA
jgi:SAM-dependent methyltransferase